MIDDAVNKRKELDLRFLAEACRCLASASEKIDTTGYSHDPTLVQISDSVEGLRQRLADWVHQAREDLAGGK